MKIHAKIHATANIGSIKVSLFCQGSKEFPIYFIYGHYMVFASGSLRSRVNFSQTLDAQKEEEFSAMLTAAGDIVSQMKRTPRSAVAAMLRRFRRHLNDQVKEEVRDGLYREIASALEAGGIPAGVIDAMTTVFVNILVEGIELVYSRCGELVVLYLRCSSFESLSLLRRFTASGHLLRLVFDTSRELIQCRPRVYQLSGEEDVDAAMSGLRSTGGTPDLCLRFRL